MKESKNDTRKSGRGLYARLAVCVVLLAFCLPGCQSAALGSGASQLSTTTVSAPTEPPTTAAKEPRIVVITQTAKVLDDGTENSTRVDFTEMAPYQLLESNVPE